MPWSPAKTMTRGARTSGASVPCTRPSCRARASSWPSAPRGLVLRSMRWRSSASSEVDTGRIWKVGLVLMVSVLDALLGPDALLEGGGEDLDLAGGVGRRQQRGRRASAGRHDWL